MVQNRIKHSKSSDLMIHFLTSLGVSEHSRAHEQSEQCEAREQVSGASDQANGRASGPVLMSGFLIVLDHSYLQYKAKKVALGEDLVEIFPVSYSSNTDF